MTQKTLVSPKELADLIEEGRKKYPYVSQANGEFIVFNGNEPVEACALGFAMLAQWNGDITFMNIDEYIVKNEDALGEALVKEVVALNDDDFLSLEQITNILRQKEG